MEDSDDEIRPVANRELPVSETRDSVGATAVVAAQIKIHRVLALNTARDESDAGDASKTRHGGRA